MLDYDEFSRCFFNRLLVERARLTRCLATSFLASAGPNLNVSYLIEQRGGEGVRKLGITEPNESTPRRFFYDRLSATVVSVSRPGFTPSRGRFLRWHSLQ